MKCFLDTNSLIHYRLFSEIDWINELATKEVEIIICPTVLQELDRKKFAELDIDIRNRCKKIISKLSEYASGDTIKENVSINFLNKEPKIDWSNEGLSSDIPDDRIIASVLEYEDLQNLVIVSSDLGLKLKSRSRDIKTHSLSDDLLIKVKKDKQEEELTKLRHRVSFLENRFPKLLLKIVDNDSYSNFKKYTYDIIHPSDSPETNNIINNLKDKLKYSPPKVDKTNLYNAFVQFSVPTDDSIKEYEKDVEKYLNDLKKYYEEEWNYNDMVSRVFELNLLLINEGTEPAEDIDIFLHFPDGFEMFIKDKYPRQPKKPKEPDHPKSLAEMVLNNNLGLTIPSSLLGPSYYQRHSPILPKGTDTSPNIKKTNSYDVRFTVDKLKHKMNIALDPLYIYFDSYESIKSFSFNYILLASNNPEDFRGELNLIF